MTKSTGVVRKLDPLGRLTLPRELLRTLGIELRDPIEIFVNGGTIVLKKYATGCSLCSYTGSELTSFYPGKLICKSCVKLIVKEESKLVFS